MEPQLALEQYEHCEAYLDYLGAVQLYNKYHAKFRRRLPAWLQVLSSASFPCTVFCDLSSVLCLLCSVFCALSSVLCLMYSLFNVLWSLWFLFTVHCSLSCLLAVLCVNCAL